MLNDIAEEEKKIEEGENIKKRVFTFPEELWSNVSEDAKDLINKEIARLEKLCNDSLLIE